jgi:hypothetical protein
VEKHRLINLDRKPDRAEEKHLRARTARQVDRGVEDEGRA